MSAAIKAPCVLALAPPSTPRRRSVILKRVLSNGRLLAWSALIAATTLLNFATAVFVEVPEDRIYRYQTAVLTLLQFGTLLAVVLLIARPGGLRDVLALRRPSSWKRAAAIGPLVAVGSLVVLIVLDPLLGAGEAQRLAAGWDPARASAFAVNAALIILVGPVVEELTFRGLEFTLLLRFGHGWAIVAPRALLEAECFDVVGEAMDGASAVALARTLAPWRAP